MQPKTLYAQLPLAILGLIALTALVACVPRTVNATSVPRTSTPPPVANTATPIATDPADPGLPAFGHIYQIILENTEYGSIVDNASAPYLNSLIAQYGLAANYTGITHPSQPNYFALFSGSTQGAVTDDVYNFSGENLADQIEAKGRTWRVFAENVPTNCFTGETARDGPDGSGVYARKHNPAISFTNISGSPARCANISDFAHFDPAAASYELIVPNLCHDMHDCSVRVGDDFLRGFVPKILDSRAWQDGGVLFILWEEGSSNLGGGGHVPLLVISNRVPKGFRSDAAYNHYSLLRTIEDAWGLGCLNQACTANNLGEFFH